MKSKTFFIVLFVLICAIPVFAGKGTVVLKKSGCDYFLVQDTNDDFILMEWMGDHDPDKGDVLVGKFNSFGSTEIYCSTHDEEVSVYIEDYGLTKRNAIEQLYEQCD